MKEGKSTFLALFHSLHFPGERDPFIPERRKKRGVDTVHAEAATRREA